MNAFFSNQNEQILYSENAVPRADLTEPKQGGSVLQKQNRNGEEGKSNYRGVQANIEDRDENMPLRIGSQSMRVNSRAN